jgi:hypothetical protein
MILYVCEIITIMIVVGFILTQIAVPLWHNLPLFPVFHKGREKKLEADLKSANQEIENLKLQLELKATRKEADELRREAGQE